MRVPLTNHFFHIFFLFGSSEQQAAAARKERDNLRIISNQKAMEEKLRENKRIADLEQRKMKEMYNFDI